MAAHFLMLFQLVVVSKMLCAPFRWAVEAFLLQRLVVFMFCQLRLFFLVYHFYVPCALRFARKTPEVTSIAPVLLA